MQYCTDPDDGGALKVITNTTNYAYVFLDKPAPACFGCYFFDNGWMLKPDTAYTLNGSTLSNVTNGVSVFDNGTLFVEDATAVFKVGDKFQCNYIFTTYNLLIRRLSKLGIF